VLSTHVSVLKKAIVAKPRMGIQFLERLEAEEVYACRTCHTHLTTTNLLVSKHFTGKTGKAFLFSKVYNYTVGPEQQRELLTGKHICGDIYCVCCLNNIGWTYMYAYDESERYKIGKFILEKALVERIQVKD